MIMLMELRTGKGFANNSMSAHSQNQLGIYRGIFGFFFTVIIFLDGVLYLIVGLSFRCFDVAGQENER